MADNEIDQLLEQLREAEGAESAPVPLERVLSDGTKVTGKDHDELFANVEAHYAGAAKEESKVAPVIPFPQPAVKTESPVTAEQKRLDIEAWARTLQQDPVAAQAMVDEIRFGGDPVARMKQLEAQLAAQNQAFIAKEIKSWQKSNKDVDLKVHAPVLDNLLKTQNLAINEENLDYVLGQARQYGWVPAPTVKTAPPAPPVAPTTPSAAPKTGAGVELVTQLLKKLDDPALTPDQRRSLMEQAGMFDLGSESRVNSLG